MRSIYIYRKILEIQWICSYNVPSASGCCDSGAGCAFVLVLVSAAFESLEGAEEESIAAF